MNISSILDHLITFPKWSYIRKQYMKWTHVYRNIFELVQSVTTWYCIMHILLCRYNSNKFMPCNLVYFWLLFMSWGINNSNPSGFRHSFPKLMNKNAKRHQITWYIFLHIILLHEICAIPKRYSNPYIIIYNWMLGTF